MRRTPSIARPSNGGKIPPKIREAVERRSGGKCEIAATPNCLTRGGHLHHRLPRSAGGPHLEDNLLDTCLQCHQWVHGHPTASYEAGWLIRRQ
jgi:hypothetical protein